MKKSNIYKPNLPTVSWKVPFIDILIGAWAASTLVLVAMLALIAPVDEKKNSGLDLKAEYIITSTWPTNENSDVDMWIKDPTGKMVSYSERSNGFITLDRDDRGNDTDTYTGDDGKKYSYPDNKEMITIRKIVPGEYRVNLHLYNYRDKQGKTFSPGDPATLSVDFEITKLNPTVKSVYKKTITFHKDWEEQTLAVFSVDKDGNFKFLNNDFRKLITRDGPVPYSGGAPMNFSPGGN